jgi:hypothetical protein
MLQIHTFALSKCIGNGVILLMFFNKLVKMVMDHGF